MGTSKSLSLNKLDAGKSIRGFSLLALVGFVIVVIGFFVDHERFWQAYLINYFLFASFAIGGVFFIATQYVTKARWSVAFRRIPESFAEFLPFTFLFGVLFVATGFLHIGEGHFGAASIYHWMDKEAVAHDHLLQHKAPYLNIGFMMIRTIVILALMYIFGKKLVRNSLLQDSDGDLNWTHKSIRTSAAFLVVFGLGFGFFSYDFLMSVEPHWFSTMFPVYTFSTLFYSTLALMAIIIQKLYSKGLFGGYVTKEHIHDLMKLVFGFCIFYGYIAFCQYMLIWYAGIPEETFFYMNRWEGSWKAISFSLVFIKFFFIFFLLLSRHFKRNPATLIPACMIIIFMALVDHLWMVYPAVGSKTPMIGISEIGFFLFFGGIFGFRASKFLNKNLLVPVKDPHIQQSVHHHVAP